MSDDQIEAVIIPADPALPPRVVAYRPDMLLDLLHAEIKCDCVDSSPQLTAPSGDRFMVWVDDMSLLADEIEHNDRAIALCRAVGYNVPDMARTAVVTGGVGPDGWNETLSPGLRDHILAALRVVP